MKFHFNGGLDCPEWILSQISSFSKIEKMIFCAICSKAAEHLKSSKYEWTMGEISDIGISTQTTNDIRSLKAIIATLSFIFEKASKYDCSSEDLEAEMLQLGIPGDHVKILIGVYNTEREYLRKAYPMIPFKADSIEIVGNGNLNISDTTDQSYLLLRAKGQSFQTANVVMNKQLLNQLRKEMEFAINRIESMYR